MTKPVAFFNRGKKAESKFLREFVTQHSFAALCPGKLTVSFFLPKDIIFLIKIDVWMSASQSFSLSSSSFWLLQDFTKRHRATASEDTALC